MEDEKTNASGDVEAAQLQTSVANGESSEGDSPGAETSTAGEEGGEEVVAVEGAEEGADREEEEEGKHKGEDREREETGEGKRDDSTEGGTAVAKHDKGIKDTAAKSASEMARDESDTTVEDKGTEREEVVKEKGEGRMEETGEDGGSKEDKDGEEPLAEGEGPSQAEPPTDGDERLQEVAEASLEKMEKKEKEKKKDKKKDKKDKKEKKEKGKKAKKPRQEGDESPAPRRKSRGGGARGGAKQLEAILVSHFQPHDPSGTGYMDPSTFWEVLQSGVLNLCLSAEELAAVGEVVQADETGQLPYAEFASHAAGILMSLYQDAPETEGYWVNLSAADGSIVVAYNKKTGDTKDPVESAEDLFEDIIRDMYQLSDTQSQGYITREEFVQMLESDQMTPYLTERDVAEMLSYFDAIPDGQAHYAEFYPLAKELILRVYRVKDPSESPWCQLSSPRVGLFWFNKFTGETQRNEETDAAPAVPEDREQEIAFLNQTYAQLESANFELEQYRQQNRELENELARASEEQETLAAQLYETGHALDEANSEIHMKEGRIGELHVVITSRDQDIEQLKAQVIEMERTIQRMSETEQELKHTRTTVEARDKSITERDSGIADLRRQVDALTDRLKTANGIIDARDSSIASLQRQLTNEQGHLRQLQKEVPALEESLASEKEQLQSTQKTLDEKNAALLQARKHLRNARERNLELEQSMEQQGQVQDKLRATESEIHTLKSFLTSKTAIVERRKRELERARVQLVELEEKDRRRAVILADVLEKTARQHQEQMTSPRRRSLPPSQGGDALPNRPLSAPAIPPTDGDFLEGEDETDYPRVRKSFAVGDSSPLATGGDGRHGSKPARKITRARTHSVPKLPPIHRRSSQRELVFPTSNDLQRGYREKDKALVDHNPYNTQCSCELCQMTVPLSSAVRPETGFTGLTAATAQSGYRGEVDSRELTIAQQVRIGARVLVQAKKSEYDLEPQKLTGVVKYVGRIDSEFVDNRLYVGLRLDEKVGDTDGLVKGKRYFSCPPHHGKVVRITNVIAVLPKKSVFYKPVQQSGSSKSPYSTSQKKSSSVGISVGQAH